MTPGVKKHLSALARAALLSPARRGCAACQRWRRRSTLPQLGHAEEENGLASISVDDFCDQAEEELVARAAEVAAKAAATATKVVAAKAEHGRCERTRAQASGERD